MSFSFLEREGHRKTRYNFQVVSKNIILVWGKIGSTKSWTFCGTCPPPPHPTPTLPPPRTPPRTLPAPSPHPAPPMQSNSRYNVVAYIGIWYLYRYRIHVVSSCKNLSPLWHQTDIRQSGRNQCPVDTTRSHVLQHLCVKYTHGAVHCRRNPGEN